MSGDLENQHDQSLESKLFIPQRTVGDSNSGNGVRPEYQLIEIVDRNSHGDWWRCVQTSTGRELGMKTIHRTFHRANPHPQSLRDHFLRNAIINADLDHPGIRSFHELFQSPDKELFCTAWLMKGTRWDLQIKTNTREKNFVIWFKVAESIAFAHSRGVVHCDIKPSRVTVGSDDHVQLEEFQNAIVLPKFRHYELVRQQRDSSICGTPAYMAPEQVSNPSLISLLTDVYLLGAILFEIVTGSPPHRGSTAMEAVKNAASNVIVPTNQSGELLEIALKAMQTAPQDRFPSVMELIKAVNQA